MVNNTTLIALDSFLDEHRVLIRNNQYVTDLSLSFLFQISVIKLRKKVDTNILRFPEDFMITLIKEEREKYHYAKYAFAEAGIFMLSGLIKTDRAAKISIAIVELLVDRRPGIVFSLLGRIQ